MVKVELIERIQELFRDCASSGRIELRRREVALAVGAPPATVLRYLNRLEARGVIERLGRSSSTRYRLVRLAESNATIPCSLQSVAPTPARLEAATPLWSSAAKDLMAKLDAPLGVRRPVAYQMELIEGYQPNQTFWLSEALANELYSEARWGERLPAGAYARNVRTSLLTDLAFWSSHLEGSKYSRSEVEILFSHGGAGPSDLDATMLLNHKQAIEFLIDDIPLYGLRALIICNVHTLLMQELLRDERALGTIRKQAVNISDSVYVPTYSPQLLQEVLERIVEKAIEVKNPVEAAFFLWVSLAYLQPFEDGNKRTSRMSANIPLLLYNCAPLSFLDVTSNDYGMAMTGIYELLDTSIAVDLFAWTYRRSIAKYAARMAAAEQPDPIRARYREAIAEVVARVVRDGASLVQAITELGLESVVSTELQRMVGEDLLRLGENNFSRYRLRMSEVQDWLALGRPIGD